MMAPGYLTLQSLKDVSFINSHSAVHIMLSLIVHYHYYGDVKKFPPIKFTGTSKINQN